MKKEEKVSFAKSKRIIARYWKITRSYQGYFWLYIFLYGLGTIIAEVFTVVAYKHIVDLITDRGSVRELFWWFGALAIFYFTFFILWRVGDRVGRIYQVQSLKVLEEFTFASFEKHSYDFYANHLTGSLTARAGRFVRSFQNLIDSFIFNIFNQIINFVAIIVTVSIFSPPFALAFFLFVALMLPFSYFLLRKRMYYDALEAEAASRTSGRLADVLSNILTVKIFAGFGRERKDYFQLVKKEADALDKSSRVWNLMTFLQNGIMIFLRLGILGAALYMWSLGNMTAGTVFLLYTFSGDFFRIFWQLTRGISSLLQALSGAQEMSDTLDIEPDITDNSHAKPLSNAKGAIRFEQVGFRYADGDTVFEDLVLEIRPQEKVGLVGPSGGGKSTLTKLLLRFADVQQGSVTIGGQDIRTVPQDNLRQNIAYVPQEPLLFHRSLYENIVYGRPDATREEVLEAARKAHAHEFIDKLAKGYETLVGERGVKLSGGQRQRVAIARAILKNAPILVLDEATSALDTVSEMKIREALDELMREKTAIVIAHRLSTVEKLDRIIVLNREGQIEEEGTHANLVKQGGLYAELWHHQSGGFLAEDDSEEDQEEA
ncbi:MAG: ABC transporter ATP-binding protein, partial [Candidatus Moraniibacteriota bacterium]